MIYILMGVSGCGKTSVGTILAERLNIPFYDGDDFHPRSNVEKMTSGEPLADEDRIPWLMALSGRFPSWERGGGAVVACSALKERYRDLLSRDTAVLFIFLKGDRETIRGRMEQRDHFMPPLLLESQFDALEEPAGALTVGIEKSLHEVVDDILGRL